LEHLQTKGILLKRELIKIYDERITFFTEDFGKLILYSFGSKSSKSMRNKLLSSYDWLWIDFQKKKSNVTLKELKLLKKNSFLQDLKKFHFFLSKLKLLYDIYPPFHPEPDLYALLWFTSHEKFMSDYSQTDEMIFDLFFLKMLGGFPFDHDAKLPLWRTSGETLNLENEAGDNQKEYRLPNKIKELLNKIYHLATMDLNDLLEIKKDFKNNSEIILKEYPAMMQKNRSILAQYLK